MGYDEFELLGGREVLLKFAKIFYDKVYKHPWLKLYFQEIPQNVIEIQQVDFLQGALGGPKIYFGKMPIAAHRHMMITEELFQERNTLLVESLKEIGAKDELIVKIIKIDDAFKSGIVKKSRDECVKRFATDTILDFPRPKRL